jgi:L-ascorbate metabolism protein UlaG (beta-lactamase superfamily)
MKITKYEHACFTVEQDSKVLVVDPGGWTKNLGTPTNVVAIVATHEHADHFEKTALNDIVSLNPEAVILAHESITGQLEDGLASRAVSAGEEVEIGSFHLEFFGGQHAVIHPDIPVVANLGVMINDTLFYPGDSFTLPGRPVEILALPISAPWLKVSETIDFLAAVHPRLAFPTHDTLLSTEGKALLDRLLPAFADKCSATYQRIDNTPLET